ncbi:D-2-hydroxyacid dehydrogenase [bacterium]|nr:D-2-hydroxyacid dehydrogenase [bacterium]
MRIVVLDGYTLNPGDNPWDDLAELGELTVHDRTPPGEVVARAAGAAIVLTNKTVIDAAALARLPDLRFIAVLATGYNVVDVAAARARGVPVANVPVYGSVDVAQHTLALLLELCHRVGDHARAVREGAWSQAPDFCFWLTPPRALAGQTLGIVGYGRIGRQVARLARALGMKVLASSRLERPAGGEPPDGWRTIPDLFAEADVISLHCPLTEDNAAFVNAALLARVRPGALLLNTARGGLIDEPALAAALAEGRLAGAALDVLSREPPPPDHPLLQAPNCVVTPHIAWASLAARRRLMAATVSNVRAFLAGSPVNIVS